VGWFNRAFGRTSWTNGTDWTMVRRASGFGWTGNWRWTGGASGSGWASRALM
jgi:hypothetical protein